MGTKTAFVVGALVGAGVALLASPADGAANREWLRRKTDELAGGDSLVGGVVRSLRGVYNEQSARLTVAIEAGRRESDRHADELWRQLKLPPPDTTPSTGGVMVVTSPDSFVVPPIPPES